MYAAGMADTQCLDW